ncbi:MAG: T9SS type A sorting domain-containing protein, partial [Candidatus Eisenbacteria bacterium]|nr:T9SS type A sorting domain-containing protein [Candidatus Eisenbacteria bacterium]
QTRAEGDTLCFGDVDGDGFAIPSGVWTFDGLQGWEAIDVTAQTATYARQITAATWSADPYNDVPAPVLSGTGSAWLGVSGTEARELCWDYGIGYGNDWCQHLVGPTLTYPGVGDVPVSWTHFNETEDHFDYTRVYLELLSSETRIDLREYTGSIGLAVDHPASPPPGISDSDILVEADFQGETQYRIVFEVTSDGSWSDEDGFYTSSYGAAGFDDVQIGASSYDFDADLQGWTPDVCPPIGTFIGVGSLSNYVIEDACQCDLEGMVLEMHAGTPGDGDHPYGQHIYAIAPPVDVLNDVSGALPGDSLLDIHVDWDQYSEMPRANGVFYRPGAIYFPYTCEVTGEVGWSDRVGQNSFFFVGVDPTCAKNRASLSATDVPVPSDAEQIRFVYELHASCDAFGIPPDQCTGITNVTPLIDNVRVCFTRIPDAPAFAIDNGLRFQDGFGQEDLSWPHFPGRADVTRNLNFGSTVPFILGDSLAIAGPVVPTADDQWEAELWFRVARRGFGAGDRYFEWRDQANAATGIDIEAGEFAFASMDSCQLGTNAFDRKFASFLKEEDWAFWGRSGPELTDDVEIIQDDVLFPGTKIEYFVTSNYLSSPNERYFLPDTSGGFFLEFEILPSWREDGGIGRYPSLLYIDTTSRGEEAFFNAALDSLGFDYDRYDYQDATSGWKAPMARTDPTYTNGCTLLQLLGYRGILLSTGASNVTQIMWPVDYAMFSDWLTATLCEGRSKRQGFIANGDGIALNMGTVGPTFLARMGANLIDDSYSAFSGNTEHCVGVEERSDLGSVYGTENSASDYEYDAYGNWCPDSYQFDVLGTIGTGTGNRVYLDRDSMTETAYAQVVNEKIELDGGGYLENYRTVIDGISWHHLTAYEPGDTERCVPSFDKIQTGAFNELAAAMEWIYEVDYGDIDWLTDDFCIRPDAVEDGPWAVPARTQLFQNAPNPFNPRTTIRFALSRSGPVELTVFDVAGRRVRSLVQGELEAGSHEVTWDGLDEAGNPLSSGIYWTQLQANGRSFSKKATVLR